MKLCPKCNAEHNLKGKFCSPKCANSRSRSAEVKNKIRDSVIAKYKTQGSKVKGRPGWKHTEEDKKLKSKLTTEMWDKKGRIERSDKEKAAINKMRVNEYRARKYNATPVDADLKLIRKIYRQCPDGYEVDHIIALSEGGLHHENNLQYLPALENRKKNKTQNYDKSLALKWQDVV